MSINPKADIQDIEGWIKLVKKGKTNKIIHFTNRLTLIPMFWKSDDEWLELLKFAKKQKEEEIKFNGYLKKKYKMKKEEPLKINEKDIRAHRRFNKIMVDSHI